MVRVLRKKEGEAVSLFDGRGAQLEGVLTKIEANSVEGRITNRQIPAKISAALRLFQGLPRGSKFDYVIEKATELGVCEIFPFLSEKSLIRLDEKQRKAKTPRWQRLATAAAKQCDRSTIPTVYAARSLKDLTDELQKGVTLVFVRDAKAQTLTPSLSLKGEGAIVNLVIGPESGFSKSEIDWLLSLGAKPVSLGALTLRTETAGLVALTLTNHELGLF